jgi:hypothetical protein
MSEQTNFDPGIDYLKNLIIYGSSWETMPDGNNPTLRAKAAAKFDDFGDWARNISGSTYNVKDYGAIGDGVTDDTTTVQAAIDAISSAGGTLLFPSGIYRIDTTLTIDKPLQIIGDGGVTVFGTNSGFLLYAKSSDVLIENITFDGTLGSRRELLDWQVPAASKLDNSNWTIRNCKFNRFNAKFSSTDYTRNDGVVVTEGADVSSNVKVLQCEFTGVETWPLKFDGVNGILVDGCYIHDIGTGENGNGIKISSGSQDYRIVNNKIYNCRKAPIDMFDSRRGIVMGNIIDGGVLGHGILIKAGETPAGDPIELVTIAHNVVRNIDSASAIMVQCDNVLVIGNIVENCPNTVGISLTLNASSNETDNGVCVGNHVSDTQYGIWINAANTTVVGNTVKGSSLYDYILYGTNTRFVGNTGTGEGTAKFLITGATNLVVNEVIEMDDSEAGNGSIYYSNDQSSLCYKNSAGTVTTINQTAT